MNGNEYKKELSKLRPRLVGIARKYLADADEAEDAVQDAMLRIWQMKEQLRLPIDSFAFILVRNISVSMLRHKRDTVPIENLAVEMPENEEQRQRMEELMTLMNSLPDRQQMILRLRHMEGMTIGEMAELFGTTENAMSKALSRARQTIRDRYTDKHK